MLKGTAAVIGNFVAEVVEWMERGTETKEGRKTEEIGVRKREDRRGHGTERRREGELRKQEREVGEGDPQKEGGREQLPLL